MRQFNWKWESAPSAVWGRAGQGGREQRSRIAFNELRVGVAVTTLSLRRMKCRPAQRVGHVTGRLTCKFSPKVKRIRLQGAFWFRHCSSVHSPLPGTRPSTSGSSPTASSMGPNSNVTSSSPAKRRVWPLMLVLCGVWLFAPEIRDLFRWGFCLFLGG